MGNIQTRQRALIKTQGKLQFTIKISSQQLQQLNTIVQQRSNFKFLYLCTVDRLTNSKDQTPNIFCQHFQPVTIQYQPYDCILVELRRTFPLEQVQIQRIIYAVSSALMFLEQKRCRHGDISTKMICRYRNQWKLIDNYFIRGGITAYQKVLEGEQGYISPAQMEKIRHGFVRQSPPIQQSDDVFALGMTCLELMTGRPSIKCYKQSFVRFNQKNFNEAILIVQQTYPPIIGNLVFAMIDLNEQKRISLKQIMSQNIINRHSKKYSLRR